MDVSALPLRRRQFAREFASLVGASLCLTLAPELKAEDADKPAKPPEKPIRFAWFPRFSYDSKWLLSAHGGWDGNEKGDAVLWEVETGEIKRNMPQPRGLRTVAWSAKGDFYLAGGYGGYIRIYDGVTGKQLHELSVGSQIEGLLVTSDDKHFVSTQGNGNVNLWDAKTRKTLQTWKGLHANGIWGLALSHDDKMLATAGQDGSVQIVDLGTFEILHALKHPRDTNGVAFSRDNRLLLTGCGDSLIRLFDVKSGKELNQLQGHTSQTVSDLQFSGDGKLLASAGGDGTVRLWDFSNPEDPKLTETLVAHKASCFGVALSPNGKWLASAGWDNKVNLWDLKTLKQRWSKTRED
jgi:WD40 repeat protein